MWRDLLWVRTVRKLLLVLLLVLLVKLVLVLLVLVLVLLQEHLLLLLHEHGVLLHHLLLLYTLLLLLLLLLRRRRLRGHELRFNVCHRHGFPHSHLRPSHLRVGRVHGVPRRRRLLRHALLLLLHVPAVLLVVAWRRASHTTCEGSHAHSPDTHRLRCRHRPIRPRGVHRPCPAHRPSSTWSMARCARHRQVLCRRREERRFVLSVVAPRKTS